MSGSKKVVKNSAVYTFFMLLQKGAAFLLLPLYTTLLSPQDYGIVGTMVALGTFLMPFMSFSLASAGTFLTYNNTSTRSVPQAWGTIFISIIFVSIISCLILMSLSPLWAPLLLKDIAIRPYVLILLGSLVCQIFFQAEQTFWSTHQKPAAVGTNNILVFLVTVISNIILVAVFHYRAEGVLFSTFIAYGIASGFSFLKLRNSVEYEFNKDVFRIAILYSLPMIPHALFGNILSMSDRILINRFIGADKVGLYNVAMQLSSIIAFLGISINKAYSPWFFENTQKGKENHEGIRKFVIVGLTGTCLLSLFVGIYSREIVMFMTGRAFHGSWVYIPVLLLSIVFQSMYFYYVVAIIRTHTRFVPLVSLSGCILSVSLNVWLLPVAGLWGAVIANVASYFLTTVVCLMVVEKKRIIKFPWKQGYLIVGIYSLGTMLAYVRVENIFMAIAFHTGVFLAGVILFGGVFYKNYPESSTDVLMSSCRRFATYSRRIFR